MHLEHDPEIPMDDGSGTGSLKCPAGEEGNQMGDGPGNWSGNCWLMGPGNWHGLQKGYGSGNSNRRSSDK